MRRREFLGKIGAVLATSASAATLAKAADNKNQPDTKRRTGLVWAAADEFGQVDNIRFQPGVKKMTYRVRFKDGHTEHRTSYIKLGKFYKK
jgi:hypothetical protein